MEGFPRSGNTFAVLAFQFAQQAPLPIAHHLHHPAQVIRGVDRGLPSVVLIRSPEAAIRSLWLHRSGIAATRLIRQYLDFYDALERVAGAYLLADFAAVTTDFGRVTDAINGRFGTHFGRFEHTDENVAAVFAQIDRINAALGGTEYHVSRPSPMRRVLEPHAFTRRERRLLGRAEALYERLCGVPGAVVGS